MTSFNLSKVVGAGVLVASLATLPLALPTSAQQNGTVTDPTQAAPGDRAVYETGEIDQGERSFDWGWIGLLGLVGLAGRLAKHRQETVVYTNPQETNQVGTTERFRDPQETNHPRIDGTTNR